MTDMHPDWIKEKMQAMRETIEALEAERAALRETITEWEIIATNLQDVLKKAQDAKQPAAKPMSQACADTFLGLLPDAKQPAAKPMSQSGLSTSTADEGF